MGVWFDAVMPILGDEGLDPRMLVAIEDHFLGAAYEQTVQVHDFLSVCAASAKAEIPERKIGFFLVKAEIGSDP